MTRAEITQKLSEFTEKLINSNNDGRIYWAREVTFDYAQSNRIRVDYMRFEPLKYNSEWECIARKAAVLCLYGRLEE